MAPTHDDDDMGAGYLDASDADSDVEATQVLVDDEPLTPTKANTSANSFDFDGASPSSRPFSQALPAVWHVMARSGWVAAQGPGTEFVSMPGTAFFNFKPNINVFDSRGKACWKWLASALATDTNENDKTDDNEVWDALWTVAHQQLAWTTMASGADTWFVAPNTTFERFEPNVTIFQSKKRAVAQCLRLQKVQITLGDSVEGPQVLDFRGADANQVKKPTPAKKTNDAFSTPSPKKSVSSSSVSKKKASSSSKTTPTSAKKSTPSSSSKKTPPKTTPSKKKTPSFKKSTPTKLVKKIVRRSELPPQFHAPAFKCTFGIVYEKLQQRGWTHRSGAFEYDYFSPAYTKENAVLGANYFQSQAQLEGFVKDSGLWQEVEDELREEHAEFVEDLRTEFERKRQQLKERLAAKHQQANADKKEKKTNTNATPTKSAAPTNKTSAKKKTNGTATPSNNHNKRKSSFAEALVPAPELKITFGKVEQKLRKRGWVCKPGRFEYDYFKPGVNPKTAKLGEDYFESSTELETHLKVSGLWDEIARELQGEYVVQLAADEANEAATEGSGGRKKARVMVAGNELASNELASKAAAVTDGIWGNAHTFDFERY